MRTLLLLLLFTFCFSATHLSAQANEQPLACGYSVELTAIGTTLVGSLKPVAHTTALLTTVNWYNAKTGALLHCGVQLNYDVQEYGEQEIKVTYQTVMANGALGCYSEAKKTLSLVEQTCMQPFNNIPNVICPTVFSPVCGCDGITYSNGCEAAQSGVSTWWAGECASQPPANTCGSTDFEVKVLSGNPSDGYTAEFTNLVLGTFTNIQLDFGDGTPIFQSSQWIKHVHHYTQGSIVNATLTAWNINQAGCVSSVSKTFATDAISFVNSLVPTTTDYVMPGDGNGDGKSNIYDLLHIGKGYGTLGSPRPEASPDWLPQYSPNWQNSIKGVNYKHIDTNGDGIINEFDIAPMEMHYLPESPSAIPPVADAPKIFVRFDQDTIVVNPNASQDIQISADVYIGTPEKPVMGLYGIACSLRYPEYVEHDPTMLYDPVFFGGTNYVLSLGHDLNDLQQFDIGFAQKNGNGANGYGRIAQVNMRADYIIIIDIIDRSDAKIIPFTMPIEGIRAIDSEGNERILTPLPDSEQDTLWIKLLETTPTKDLFKQGKISLFPNPASNTLTVSAPQVDIQSITLFNMLGQQVKSIQPSGVDMATFDVSGLQRGTYTVRVISANGVGEQKVVLK